MPSTLFAKLLVVVLVFCTMMTATCILLMRGWHARYHEEVDQIANRDTASLLVGSSEFSDATQGSTVDQQQAIAKLARLNPAWDIYLLDAAGQIIGASFDSGRLARQRIDLRPVRSFLEGTDDLPIYGDDPQTTRGTGVFSAAAIDIPASQPKYLYLLLGRADHAAGLQDMRRSQAINETVWVLIFSAFLGLLASVAVMRLLTRNLGRLETAMLDFRGAGFRTLPERRPGNPSRSKDEISRLTDMFWDLAERLQEKIQALEQSDEVRRDILANVSHDLRTPIASLSAHLETLALDSGMTEAERDEYLATSIRQCEVLGAFVDQLLEAAYLEAGQVKLHAEPFQVTELLHDVAQKFRLRAQQAGIALAIECPSDLPLANGDIALVERALDNLLDNALQHTGPDGRVALAAKLRGNRVEIVVSDTGVGLTPGERERVRERFYRGDSSRGGGSGHAGLGLAIVNGIVALHGGQFDIDSEPGQWTCCKFDLPLAESVSQPEM